MKKYIALILAILMVIGVASFASAAGSVTVKLNSTAHNAYEVLTFSFTGDASNGTVPATSSSGYWPAYRAGCVAMVVTDPGSTAPTDLYDVTLTDDTTGVDIMGGELANLSNTTTEQNVPKIGSVYGCRPITDAFTLNLSNNSVNSATGVVYVYISLQ